jgi:hypothetical protein
MVGAPGCLGSTRSIALHEEHAMTRAEAAPAALTRCRPALQLVRLRRLTLAAALGPLVFLVGRAPALAAAPAAPLFGFEDVSARAQALAKEAFKDPHGEVPAWLTQITYDQWRDVRFRPDHALWRDKHLQFQVQFFHPGLYYDRTVAMNAVDDQGVHPIPFSPSDFDYGHNDFASRVPQNLGFAGFRVHFPIKRKDYFDEVIVFLGASYFRAIGKEEVFGLSARGIAIDTALSSGEEFPYFKEFWLVTPPPGAKELTIYALLDSASLTGAYRFAVRPGESTAVTVDARIFLRRAVKKLGIAPLNSMFLHGENSGIRTAEDFRPEVHDSDGLLVNFASGEWLWRPLDNPRALGVSALLAPDIRGYGLIQRDRSRALSGPRDAARAAAERLGGAARCVGRGARRAGRNSDQARHQRQHRHLLGAQQPARAGQDGRVVLCRLLVWRQPDRFFRRPRRRHPARSRHGGWRLSLRRRFRRQEDRVAARGHGAARRGHGRLGR